MRLLNLGIDFDGVVTDPTQLKIDWFRHFCGIELKPEQTARHVAQEIVGKSMYQKMIHECYQGYWAERNQIRVEAIECLRRLIDRHHIYIITARADFELKAARRMIGRYNVPHTAIYNTSGRSKEGFCRKLNIRVFLDDSPSQLERLKGIPDLLLVYFNFLGESRKHDFYEVHAWFEFENLIKRISKGSE